MSGDTHWLKVGRSIDEVIYDHLITEKKNYTDVVLNNGLDRTEELDKWN